MMAISEGRDSSRARQDCELVRAVLRRDKTAYGELYDRYARLIRAICYDVTGTVPDAQDLAQDVFLRAYERLGELRRAERFAAWLVGIARMVCREWLKRQVRSRHRTEAFDPDKLAQSDSGSADLDGLGDLHRALLRLPARERVAVEAFYLLGQSPEQAGSVLGLCRSGFYRVLQRARGRLKRLMSEDRENSA